MKIIRWTSSLKNIEAEQNWSFYMESSWEAQSEVTDMHEQLMEELVLNDSLFNNDWIPSKQTESQIFQWSETKKESTW